MDPSKKRNNTDLPDFFMKYDDPLLAREHLVKMDLNQPNTVTHFCSVPLDKVVEAKSAPDYEQDKVFWPLKNMTVDRLSKLLTILGRSRNGMNKSQMIAMIQSLDHENVNVQALLDKKNLKKLKEDNSSTKAVMRFVNVMFSPVFQKKFEDINMSKTRGDLEHNTEKKLFAEISEYINDDTCGYHDELLPCEDGNVAGNYNFYISKDRISNEMHPSGVLVKKVTGKVCAGIYSDLFRIRKTILMFMTQSGTHDGSTNPWTYVVNAIKKCKLTSYCPFAVFYFYMQCSFHKGIADAHTHVLKDCVKDINYVADNSTMTSSKKKGNQDDMLFMKTFCDNVGNEMTAGTKMRANELKERKLHRLFIEHNTLKKSIDSGKAKRIKLIKEYRKCKDDFSKEYTMKLMEEIDTTLKSDEAIFEKLLKEYKEAKEANNTQSPVKEADKVEEHSFPVKEIVVTHATKESGSLGDKEPNDIKSTHDDKTVIIRDDSDDDETMI